MTVEHYGPEGESRRSRCDVCQVETLDGVHDDETDKALLEAAGWRWQERHDPLDTCPKCLHAERTEQNPPHP